MVGQSDPKAAQQAVAKADPTAEQAVIGSTGALDQDQISGDTISQLVGVRIATPFFGTGFNFCVGERASWLVSGPFCLEERMTSENCYESSGSPWLRLTVRPVCVTHHPCMAVGSGSSELSGKRLCYSRPDS